MVVAAAALFVALAGTGIAAVGIPRNSVGTANLKPGAVTNAKIRNGAVTSAKVRDFSLLRRDFRPGQLPRGPIGLQGLQGPAGPAGPAGPQGPQGPAGVVGTVSVRTASTTISDALDDDVWTTGDVSRNCESNERAMSAGVAWSDTDPDLELVLSSLRPVADANNNVIGFSARGANDSSQSSTLTLFVLCYRV
jgi:hypothetical protein